MAQSGSFAISTTSTNDITGRIEWSESNVSIAHNTSDLNVKLIYRMNNSYYATYGSGYFKITVNGVAYENNHYVQFASGTHEYTVIDHTFTITHDANGAKSVSIVLNNGYVAGTSGLSASSGSGTATLTTIARASQPSTTNGTFGSAITINTNRASSSFTHTLTMTMGSHSETKTGVGASLSWTIPASWADTIPAATSNTLSISCVTYNGSTNIGTKTTSCTATIPDSWKPSVSISKTLTNSGYNSQVIANVTTVNLSASGTASTGTSISSYSWSGGAVSGTGASKTHSPTTVATFTYTVTVTDRRGRTGTATVKATSESGVSSFSCANSVNFGSALAVTITRKKSSFKHDVKWKINSSYSYQADDQGTSASYTIPTSWAASVPAASSINMTVTVWTKSGSTALGYVEKTVSVIVPSSWVPDFTLSKEAVNGFNGAYLKGYSKIKLTASSATPSTGSQIQSYLFTGTNLNKSATTTATSYNATSDILYTTGSVTYTVKVTDKRGRVTTKTTSITVTDYRVPTLHLSVARYTSGGVADSFGTYGRIKASGTWSNISGNKWNLSLKYKLKSASSYTTVNSYSDQTAASISKTSDLFSANVDNVYDCQGVLTDAVGKTITVNVALSTGKAIADVYKDNMVSFYATASQAALEALSTNDALFSNANETIINNNLYMPAKLSRDGYSNTWFHMNDLSAALLLGSLRQGSKRIIPDNSNISTYDVPGTYWITGNASAQTMTNLPEKTAGMLIVLSTTGDVGNASAHTYQYLHQYFIPYSKPQFVWARYGDNGTTNFITWGEWQRKSAFLSTTSKNLYVSVDDVNGYTFNPFTFNGYNIWIGSWDSASRVHQGGTYISTGWSTNGGRQSVYIAVPTTYDGSDGMNLYFAHHNGYHMKIHNMLGSSTLNANATVTFTDSAAYCDFYIVWCRNNSANGWQSMVIPAGRGGTHNWVDGSNYVMVDANGGRMLYSLTANGTTYTLKNLSSVTCRFYVEGWGNPT